MSGVVSNRPAAVAVVIAPGGGAEAAAGSLPDRRSRAVHVASNTADSGMRLMPPADLPGRLAAKIDFTDTCWLWTKSLNRGGYGLVWWDGKTRAAHRVVYELLVAPVPTGLVLDHVRERCSHRRCVNPAHLEPVTVRENTLRGDNHVARLAQASHCVHGHEYTPENTLTSTNCRGRVCRTCARERQRKHRHAARSTAASITGLMRRAEGRL